MVCMSVPCRIGGCLHLYDEREPPESTADARDLHGYARRVAALRTRGVSYFPEAHPPWDADRVMGTLRNELWCTSVMLIGDDVDVLAATAETALAAGLDVVPRPSKVNRRARAVLQNLDQLARAAEELRAQHPGRVTLLVGNEFSFTSRGIVPGPTEMVRLRLILRARRLLRRRIHRRVDALLRRAVAVARQRFHGPVGYAAALWEDADHGPFDFVGVNLYRTGTDHEGYQRRVRHLVASAGKPVVVTEFGCGAQVGGDVRGPGSFTIVNRYADPPRIRNGHRRDESVQARYLTELIDLYAAEGVAGCFVFNFAMPEFPHRDDPVHDRDMAGFGIVAVPPDDPSSWRPKQAFHAVAERYAALS
jgi:hypothetical protein